MSKIFKIIKKDINKEIKEYGDILDCLNHKDCEFNYKNKKGNDKYVKYY